MPVSHVPVPTGIPAVHVDEPPWQSLLRDQLAADGTVRKNMTFRLHPRGVFMCGMRLLGANGGFTVLYTFLVCGDYSTGALGELRSGSGLPAVIRLTGPRGDLAGVEFPQQATLDEDIDRMFPADLAQVVRDRPQETVPTQDELDAIARSLPDLPSCRARELTVRAAGDAGPGLGSWYSPISVGNAGPDCLVTSLSLTLWAGDPAAPLAALDLRGRQRHVVRLDTGESVLARLSAPNEQCVRAGAGQLHLVPLGYSDSVSHALRSARSTGRASRPASSPVRPSRSWPTGAGLSAGGPSARARAAPRAASAPVDRRAPTAAGTSAHVASQHRATRHRPSAAAAAAAGVPECLHRRRAAVGWTTELVRADHAGVAGPGVARAGVALHGHSGCSRRPAALAKPAA